MAIIHKTIELNLNDKVLGPHTFQTRWSDGRVVNALTMCQYINTSSVRSYLNRKSCKLKMKKCVSELTRRHKRVQINICIFRQGSEMSYIYGVVLIIMFPLLTIFAAYISIKYSNSERKRIKTAKRITR